jgi:hypothetical protein
LIGRDRGKLAEIRELLPIDLSLLSIPSEFLIAVSFSNTEQSKCLGIKPQEGIPTST